MLRHWIYTVPLRLRSIFRRAQVERELDEELRFHLEARIQQEIASGKSPEQARYASLHAMNGMEQRKEECRDMRRVNLIDDLVRDLRYALRTLARNPGFTLAAMLALALGIGANTAVFSVVNSVLLHPLPFAEPDRLVMIFNSRPAVGITTGPASMADILDWKARSRSFQTMAAINFNRFTLTGDSDAEQIVGMSVSAGFFATLRASPLLGRTFAADEDQPGRTPTIVLSERLWNRRYASDPGILEKQVVLNGRPHTVIGVMPGDVEFGPRTVEAWPILTLTPPTRRGPFVYRGIARLKPGVTVAQAASEMQAIAHEVERVHPKAHTDLAFPVVPMHEVMVGRIRPLLWVLSGAVGFVLLIAVSNVANLMLARASARGRESAIRLSIGAGRGRLVRQFMTESLMLSLGGGALGIALALWGVKLLRWLGPGDLPRLNEIDIDGRVLAFTLAASIASALAFGLAPAFAASAGALNESLKQGGRAGEAPGRVRVRGALVVAQVTFSVLLLVGAGLLIRSFHLLGSVDPGFHAAPERLLTMNFLLTGSRYEDPRAVNAYWSQLLERVRTLPGIDAGAVAATIPPDRLNLTDDYQIEGKPLPPGTQHPAVPVPFVSQGYFETLGIPLLQGRRFDSRDRAGTAPVTIISETMARRHFAGENPLGRRIRYKDSLEIIGVVGDVKYRGLEREDEPVFYRLASQAAERRMWLLVRTQGDAVSMASAVRQEIRALDPAVPVDRVGTMAQALSESVSLPRFRFVLMTVFAATALLLAAIGIYGLIAWSVTRRIQEIGVRMALGATPPGVLRLVIGQAARLASVGVVLGLVGAFALSRVLERMLFGVTVFDTVTFAGAALLLGTVAVVASLLPALRAARVDPVTALRHE
jgi:predicted permease